MGRAITLYEYDDVIEFLKNSSANGATLPKWLQTYEDDEVIKSVDELASAIGLSYSQVLYRAKRGKIPFVRRISERRNYLFSAKEVRQWLKNFKVCKKQLLSNQE